MRQPASESPQGRVAVMRGTHLVPLFSDPHRHTATGQQPWAGVVLEQHTVRPGEIPEHEHPTLCLHLQVEGEAPFEWWQGGKNAIEQTRPGSMILIPPGTQDRILWQGSSDRLILSIEDEALASLTTQPRAQHPPEITGGWSIDHPAMRLLITEMGREAREHWPLGTLYADLLSLSLKTILIRDQATEQLPVSQLRGGLSLPRLKRAMEYIHEHLAEDVSLEQIAGEMGMSASHFAHEFRNSTRTTPYQYLMEQRLDRARTLLQTTKLPIQNVSALSGFNYPANFVRTFRQRTGLTPEAWRNTHSS